MVWRDVFTERPPATTDVVAWDGEAMHIARWSVECYDENDNECDPEVVWRDSQTWERINATHWICLTAPKEGGKAACVIAFRAKTRMVTIGRRRIDVNKIEDVVVRVRNHNDTANRYEIVAKYRQSDAIYIVSAALGRTNDERKTVAEAAADRVRSAIKNGEGITMDELDEITNHSKYYSLSLRERYTQGWDY